MPKLLYDLLILCATPLAFLYFAWRGRHEPDYRRHWKERLGFWQLPRHQNPQHYEWIHAASMGEVESAKILILNRLNNNLNKNNLMILSVFTPTGRAHAHKIFAEYIQKQQIIIQYLPFDSNIFLQILFNNFNKNKIKITQFWLIETEIWVNLLDKLAKNKTDMIIASGRLSANPAQKYKIIPSLARMKQTLAHFRVIAVQTESDAKRYITLGANKNQIKIMGNLKYDQAAPINNLNLFAHLNAPRWLAASTHEVEERLALAAHEILRKTYPNALLCLAPRHPQRFAEVEGLLFNTKYQTRNISNPKQSNHIGLPQQDHAVFLLNTLGELSRIYSDFNVVFMGGTAANIGGHNILEATRQSCVVIVGKYVKTIQTEVNHLIENQALIQLDLDLKNNIDFNKQAEILAQTIHDLWANPQNCAKYGARAKQWTDNQQGSLERLLRAISNG